MWKRLTHPNVLPLLGVTIDHFQLISNWMPGGNLSVYIKKNPDADLLGLVRILPFAAIPRLLQLLVVRRLQRSLLPPLVQCCPW